MNIHLLLKKASHQLINVYDSYDYSYNVASQLLCFVCSVKNVFFIQNISIDQEILFFNYIKQIYSQKKPLEYIIGNVNFLDCFLYIESPVLIPRPETEFFIDFCIKKITKKELKILDMCTGSGCIAIACATHLNCVLVDAVDIDEFAIELCKKNVNYHQLKEIQVIKSDLFENLQNKKYDYIFSNPPYISLQEYEKLDESVKKWESKIALTDEFDGLTLVKKIIQEGCQFLFEDGFLAIELSPMIIDQAIEFIKKINKYSFYEIIFDQYGKKRFLILHFQ